MNWRNSKIRNIFLFLGLSSIGLLYNDTLYAAPTSEALHLNDSVEQKLLDEVFISRYLRFFDGTYKEPSNKVLYQERPELQGNIPFYSNTDSVYRARLEGLNKNFVVKLPYNEKVKNYIDVYVNKKRKQVNVMLALSQYYFPIFEEAMEKQGIPKELKYLAVIESALNPRAVSPVGASGIWQFMYQTGRMYDLKINSKVDERLDPNKASMAAATYLKELYRCFGDWTLAIAAYNCGPGNVNKAIRKAKGKTDFWEIYPFLPRETRGYVPAYIGATYIMNYYKEHGYYMPRQEMPLLTDTVLMDQDIDMKQVAEVMNIPLQILRDLNPQYKQDIIPGKTDYFSLRLPVNLIGDFLEYKDSILSDSVRAAGLYRGENVSLSHRIRKGETLSSIAQGYGVKVNDLMSWNNLHSSLIYPNQVLHVLAKKNKASELAARPIARVDPSKIENNESRTSITTTSPRNTSIKPDSSNAAAAATASLANSPKPSEKQAGKSKIVSYTVRKGESLYSICKRNPGSTIAEIISLNNLPKNGSLIYPNQVLKIEIH